MKRTRKAVTNVLIAALTASAIAIFADASAAHAGPDDPGTGGPGSGGQPTAPPSAVVPEVIGNDSDGNPVYSTGGNGIVDPAEDSDSLSDEPFAEVPETEGKPDATTQGTGETCPAKTTGTVRNIPNSLKVDWADSVINRTSGKVSYTVKAETSKKFTWSVGASVSGEGKLWIFAKVSATINGNIAHEKSTIYGSSITVEVPAHKTMKADRGMWQEKFSYKYKTTTKNCSWKSGSGTGWAPYRQAWHVYS